MSTIFQFIAMSLGTVTLLCMWHQPLIQPEPFISRNGKTSLSTPHFVSSMPRTSPLLPVSVDLLLALNGTIHCLFRDWLISLSLLSSQLICVDHMPSSPFHSYSSIFTPVNSHVASITWLSWIILLWTWVYDHLFQSCLRLFCVFMQSGNAGSWGVQLSLFSSARIDAVCTTTAGPS